MNSLLLQIWLQIVRLSGQIELVKKILQFYTSATQNESVQQYVHVINLVVRLEPIEIFEKVKGVF